MKVQKTEILNRRKKYFEISKRMRKAAPFRERIMKELMMSLTAALGLGNMKRINSAREEVKINKYARRRNDHENACIGNR